MSKPLFHAGWPPFEYNGRIYDLSHLDERILTIEDSSKEYNIIAVTFGDHCFTRNIKHNDDEGIIFPGCSRNPGAFCFDRYKHSLLLPKIVDGLEYMISWNLHKDHYAVIPTVEDDGKKVLYGIIFSIDKVKGLDVHLHMRIRTAHLRDERPLDTFGSVKFKHLVYLRRMNKRPRQIMDRKRKRPRIIEKDIKK